MTASHKFKAGQTAYVRGHASPQIPGGRYQVVRLLPADAEGNRYRVKSHSDGHERVVREADLS
jgi:hypothetical protein